MAFSLFNLQLRAGHLLHGSYEPVTAIVIDSHYVYTDVDGDPACIPIVVYRYTIAGETFEGDKVCSMDEHGVIKGDLDWVKEIMRDYPAGGQVTAYVNPLDHSDAYLIEVEHSGLEVTLFVGGGAVFMIIGLLVLVQAVRGKSG